MKFLGLSVFAWIISLTIMVLAAINQSPGMASIFFSLMCVVVHPLMIVSIYRLFNGRNNKKRIAVLDADDLDLLERIKRKKNANLP